MLQKLWFNLSYFRKPVWDTGISPPELMEFVSQHAPGRALDLGCGSGTNVITLAKHGWQVTGVDFARRAIQIASKKAQLDKVTVNLSIGDVTRLDQISGHFDLILDIGCYHSLSVNGRKACLSKIVQLLSPSGIYLLYVFFKSSPDEIGPGVTVIDIDAISQSLQLIKRQDGSERGRRPSAWLTYQKPL
jgi:2-polyprenyl-3-methyl-5-hydroxy-6-metoxy-1,4-benzoquinol methylase